MATWTPPTDAVETSSTWTPPPTDAVETSSTWTPPVDAVEVAQPAADWEGSSNQLPTPTSAPKERSVFSDLVRGTGMAARDVLTAAGSIPQSFGNIAIDAARSVQEIQKEYPLLAGQPSEPVKYFPNMGSLFADYLGLSKPQNPFERVVHAGAQAALPAVAGIGLGNLVGSSKFIAPQIVKNITNASASQPAAQLLANFSSGGGAQMAKEGGLGEGAQLAAAIAAPLVTLPLAAGTQALGRAAKNIVAPLVSQKAADVGAARLALRAVGNRGQQVATELAQSAPTQTAGQVAAAIDNADLAALQSIANKTDATLTETIKKGINHRLQTSSKALDARLAPVREEAMTLAKIGGVDINPILNKIDAYRKLPGNASDTVLKNVTGDIRSKIAAIAESGAPDPQELYTIRKEIGDSIKKFSKESASWNQKKSASIERNLQLAIDDAIESAIVKADPRQAGIWSKNYMAEYAKGRAAISNVEKALDREVELAGKGLSSVSERIGGADSAKIPSLLSRVATITNTLLRATEGAAGSKVQKSLTQMMAPTPYGGDKVKLGKLMLEELNKPPTITQSLFYKNKSPTRAELGYGTDQMGVPVVEGMLSERALTKPNFQQGKPTTSYEVIPNAPRLTYGNSPILPVERGNIVRIPNDKARAEFTRLQEQLRLAREKENVLKALSEKNQSAYLKRQAQINREKIIDISEEIQTKLEKPRPSYKGYGQGEKTRKFQRGLLTDNGEPL